MTIKSSNYAETYIQYPAQPKSFLIEKSSETEADEKTIFIEPQAQGKKMIIKKLADRLGLERKEMLELLQLYTETAGKDIETLKTALKTKNTTLAHEKAHAIKGASGNMGLQTIYELAMEIDDRVQSNSLDGLEDIWKDLYREYQNLVNTIKESDN